MWACIISSVALGTIGAARQYAGGILVWAGIALLASISPFLALVDVTLQRLPDRIVLATLGLITLVDIVGIAVTPEIALRALACAGGVAVIAGLDWALPRSTLGLGDVKVMTLTALVTGSISLAACIAAIVAGFLLAGLAAAILLATRKARRSSMIAFGPYLLAGSWLAIFFA